MASTAAMQYLNPDGASVRGKYANAFVINGAKGLMNVLKTNLGPVGTMKMLVGGAGQIKMTKDGSVLLGEMQIQHPTAMLVARAATAMDDETGDGTTSTVVIIGEALSCAEELLNDGIHPRTIAEGYDVAAAEALKFLSSRVVNLPDVSEDRELLDAIARSSLATKINPAIVDTLAKGLVDAVLCVRQPDQEIDLHMVEIMHMRHKLGSETKFIPGLVLDHGGRHPEMPKHLENCYILTCNVSLEYEKSELNSGFYYKTAAEKEKMGTAERGVVDKLCQKIVELKKQVCPEGSGKGFVVINQKGIDPLSLDILARNNILGLRRAKRRNMERIQLCCGGEAVNCFDGLTPDVLGYAGLVYEHALADEKYTFIEQPRKPSSCTILIKGPNDHTIAQIKEAVRDGLRAVRNAIEDDCLVAGAADFETACKVHLDHFADTKAVKESLTPCVKAFGDALMAIPRTLCESACEGGSAAALRHKLERVHRENYQKPGRFGLDLSAATVTDPQADGVYDNFRVKRQQLEAAAVISTQLLLIDEVMKAGSKRAGKGGD
eukprot:TRINITY_DN39230_c0_g1_i1.p1 TRINITY_DN39230_c0_g1~~TRINITY_DN39230_c0_g1_i1.p1  ORF type:complete len:573 (+),score=213.10 TRINITY_DN39230_c0_g1_i1:75-1721(+)